MMGSAAGGGMGGSVIACVSTGKRRTGAPETVLPKLDYARRLVAALSLVLLRQRDATGLIALSGGSVVTGGDSMTVWVNAATKKAAKVFVATTYQGDAVTMNATFNTLPTGLDYVNFADIQIPSRSMEVQVSNFNYNKNN